MGDDIELKNYRVFVRERERESECEWRKREVRFKNGNVRFLWGPEFCVCVFFEDGPRSYDSIRLFFYLFIFDESGFWA